MANVEKQLTKMELDFSQVTRTRSILNQNQVQKLWNSTPAKYQYKRPAKGGGNYSETQEFVLFDVKVGEWYLKREDVEDVAEKFSLKVVPIVATGTLQVGVDMVKAGLKSQWGDFIAEGLVAKPTVDLFNRKGERILTKIKHEDFAK